MGLGFQQNPQCANALGPGQSRLPGAEETATSSLKVSGLGFRARGFMGARVRHLQALGFGVWGSGLGVWGLGFGVWGLGLGFRV